MTEFDLHTKVDLENGSPTFAKPVLYEVPTYLAESQIVILNRKTKRKKSDGKILNRRFGCNWEYGL